MLVPLSNNTTTAMTALERETNMRALARGRRKIELVRWANPDWRDLRAVHRRSDL